MKRISYIFWTIILVLYSINSYSQTELTNNFYYESGQLKMDTSIVLNQDNLKIWKLCAKDIIAILKNEVKYSNLARDAGLQGETILIINFSSDSLIGFRLMKNLGGGLNENIYNSLKRNRKKINSLIRENCNSTNEIDCKGAFYIPFEFRLYQEQIVPERGDVIQVLEKEIPLKGCE